MDPKHINKLLLLSGLILLFLALCLGSPNRSNGSSIAECEVKGKLLMESYVLHRILEEERYISYGALKKDKPACGSAERGAPYRSCYPDPSNPYSRGCSRIYKCRDDS